MMEITKENIFFHLRNTWVYRLIMAMMHRYASDVLDFMFQANRVYSIHILQECKEVTLDFIVVILFG